MTPFQAAQPVPGGSVQPAGEPGLARWRTSWRSRWLLSFPARTVRGGGKRWRGLRALVPHPGGSGTCFHGREGGGLHAIRPLLERRGHLL